MCDCQNKGSQFNSFYNEYTDGTYNNADGRGTSFLEGLVGGFLGTNEQQPPPAPPQTGMGMQTPPPPTESFWKRNGLMIGGVVVLGAVITGILIFKSRNK